MTVGIIGSAGVGQALGHGFLAEGRAIEPLYLLWCIPGFLRNEWTHAFKLLKL